MDEAAGAGESKAGRRGTGVVLLLVATAIWGSSFAAMKLVLPGAPASLVNLGRFAIAAIALAPFARRDARLWARGAELGAWLFAGYATQIVGLNETSMDRSAFITSLAVVFVPLIGALAGRKVRKRVWIAAAAGVAGCALMCHDGQKPNAGDFWTLATAIFYAVYIARMEAVAPQFASLPLASAQITTVMALSAIWFVPHLSEVRSLPWAGLLYLGLACTAATTWMQAIAQKTVPAPQTALVFTLEPVFAAGFGYVLFGQTLGERGMIGAGLIVAAAVAACLQPGLTTEH
ncbi:MAG: DMT family transporter [Tepidisphaeraceae bacterium]|jgi:drug/metabolite transporter (DMT)-like permease